MNTLLRIALFGVYAIIVLALIVAIAIALVALLPLGLALAAGLICGYFIGPLVFLGFDAIEECVFTSTLPSKSDREYVVHDETD